LLAWFSGICGTRHEQHLLNYASPYGANPQQCEFAFGNDQGLLALRGISMFAADCGCQPIYPGDGPHDPGVRRLRDRGAEHCD
jgi:hypothetical protein